MPCTCSARTDVTPSWLCSTPSTIRNGSSTIDQPIAREQIGPHDDVGDAGFVLEGEEDEPFRGPGPLAGDDHAGDPHAAALPGGAEIARRASRRASPAPRAGAPSDAGRRSTRCRRSRPPAARPRSSASAGRRRPSAFTTHELRRVRREIRSCQDVISASLCVSLRLIVVNSSPPGGPPAPPATAPIGGRSRTR